VLKKGKWGARDGPAGITKAKKTFGKTKAVFSEFYVESGAGLGLGEGGAWTINNGGGLRSCGGRSQGYPGNQYIFRCFLTWKKAEGGGGPGQMGFPGAEGGKFLIKVFQSGSRECPC